MFEDIHHKLLSVPLSPTGFNYTREYHEDTNTTIAFKWDPPHGSGPEAIVDYYTLSITPPPLSHPCMMVFDMIQSRQWNATLAHNTMYSINLTAVNCRGRSDALTYSIEYSKIVTLKFCLFLTNYFCAVNCGIPMPPMNGLVGGYLHTREEANVTFWCDDGYRPSDIVTSTCTDTGFWIPAPHRHNCTFVTGKE